VEYQWIGSSGFRCFVPSTVPFCGAWNGRDASGRGLSFGTLLGPEATGLFFPVTEGTAGAPFWGCPAVVPAPGAGSARLRGVRAGVTGLLFENCIVDASIL
jgi:hypothetical protein